MTAHQLKIFCRSWGAAQQRLATTTAWMAANWSRAKRMPALSRVLDRIDAGHRPKRYEDWTERDVEAADDRIMRAAMMMAASGKAGAGEVD